MLVNSLENGAKPSPVLHRGEKKKIPLSLPCTAANSFSASFGDTAAPETARCSVTAQAA